MIAWDFSEGYRELKAVKDERSKLDYLIMYVNGQAKKVSNNEEITFIRGDVLKIGEAYLKDERKSSLEINILGVEGSDVTTDFRMKSLDTSNILTTSVAPDAKEGIKFPVLVKSNSVLHGVVFLRRVEPVLGYIDVLINGKKSVMREGQEVRVKKKDKFKVVHVVTNLSDSKNITFEVVPYLNHEGSNNNEEKFNIVFQHKNFVFAKIPLLVEKL